MSENTGKISDGYHTFGELYEHRVLLFMNLMLLKGGLNHGDTWKAKKHDDGSSFEGWFVAGMNSLSQPITYHLPIKYWDICPGAELNKAPKWDRHTSNDVLKRLKDQLLYSAA